MSDAVSSRLTVVPALGPRGAASAIVDPAATILSGDDVLLTRKTASGDVERIAARLSCTTSGAWFALDYSGSAPMAVPSLQWDSVARIVAWRMPTPGDAPPPEVALGEFDVDVPAVLAELALADDVRQRFPGIGK